MTKTNVPRLRFKEFHEGWKEKRLDSVSNIIGGGTPSTSNSEYWNGNINWFSPVEIGDSKYVSHSLKKITSLGLKKSSAKILPKGSLLFTSRAGIGKTAILLEESSTNQGFQSIVPDKDELEIEFLYGLSGMLSQYGNKMGSGSTFVEVSGKTMGKMKLILPNFAEQKKIGKFLSKIDNLIELQTQKLEQLKKLKQGYLQKMFPQDGESVPRLRFSGFSEEWEKKTISEITTRLDNKRIPVKEQDRVSGNVPYYGANGVQGYVKGFTHTGNNILIAEDGASDVSNYPVIFTKGDIWVNNHAHVLQSKDSKSDSSFMSYALKLIRYDKYLTGNGRFKLNADVLMKINLLIPSFEEQQQIGSFLSKLDQMINDQSDKIEALKQQKKAYLQKMFI